MKQRVSRQVGALADRMARAWQARRGGSDLERRLEDFDTRMRHLENALEGLQDAVYRQAVRSDQTQADMRERTDPARIARELSADARRRGL